MEQLERGSREEEGEGYVGHKSGRGGGGDSPRSKDEDKNFHGGGKQRRVDFG